MTNHPTLGQTLDFIIEAHSGQTDRMGVPYWLHCVRVMCLLPANADDEMRHAALLHDVLEDTEVTRSELRLAGYSHRVVTAVSMLTRVKNGGSYDNYIRYVGAEEATCAIKIADLRDNLSPDRAAGLTPEMEARYRKALAVLEGKG